MKILWIGDVHLRLSDLSEADSIIDQFINIIKSEKPEKVVLAGDIFDSFAVVRSEVLSKWTRFFIEGSKHTPIYALVGNHDMAGADGGVSAMEPFKAYENVSIISDELSMFTKEGVIHFLPFIRDKEVFEAKCKSLDGSFLFCHQSFNGAQFENGFYDPHGADVSCVKHLKAVISGHVHKKQIIENISYLGTPRQLTFSDAGEDKAVYTINLNKDGYTIEKAHRLDVPEFVVYEAGSVETLLDLVDCNTPNPKFHYKFIAKGTPSEISQFWEAPEVKEFKSKAKRVVDALTSSKPVTAFVAVGGATQEERLSVYVKQRKWRTDADQLARRAREYLIS